jgi:hypothetical protein
MSALPHDNMMSAPPYDVAKLRFAHCGIIIYHNERMQFASSLQNASILRIMP